MKQRDTELVVLSLKQTTSIGPIRRWTLAGLLDFTLGCEADHRGYEVLTLEIHNPLSFKVDHLIARPNNNFPFLFLKQIT